MKHIVRIVAWIVLLTSVLVIVGWFFDIESFKSIIPGFVTMKFTTALSFLLSSFILFFSLNREMEEGQWADIVIPASTFVILLFMGTTLLSSLFGFKSGIENLFVQERPDALFTSVPGRPSLGTALAFLSLAFLGIVATQDLKWRKVAYRVFGVLIFVIAVVALVGYALSMPVLFYLIAGISTAMALHTAVLFLLLGVGFFLLSYTGKKTTYKDTFGSVINPGAAKVTSIEKKGS